ncbi:uncharacterized protein [Oryza sativa Japonica Group]|uniref:Expressed protein n=2 Tax=Oryza sativa subsp. japonica TaxID=39947 RepID=Q2QQB0_ORYSJ|nr:uncharacterized protein LOC107278197 [Oryza sativa Japonica Group]ABA99014.1 expressed protein [Oryza sativa Japonica Group]EAZ20579.1 hypothetical protein OsJ_36188 [Oryza sativa Japonica Group]BAT17251.1 Os12g0500900 [Oryza sativa Japonica Group]
MDHQSSGGGHCSNPPSCGFCGRATVAISFAAVPAGFCTCNVCLRDLAGVLGYRCPLCNFTVHRQGCRRPHHHHPPPVAYTQHQRASSYNQAPVAASSPRASGSRRKRVKTFVIRLVEKVIGLEKNGRGGGGGGRKKKGKGKGGGGEDEEEEEEEEEEEGYDD